MSLIEASDISKEYSDFKLKNVDFEVNEGEIVGVLGPNGAGKSTFMKILTGQIERDSGDLEVLGIDPQEDSVNLRAKIGVLPEREDPPSFLTGREYLNFVSDIREEVMDWEFPERMNLNDHLLDQQTRELSKGERQKLMVIQAFFHEPELVFIDEPLINLDPLIQEEVKEVFREHRERGGSMVLSTHLVSLAEELCDRVLFLKDGEVIEEVTEPENLKEQFISSEEE
ncbi:MAG: ABC transporter ATP-binding protein [Candidatus Nanohaloarchaea archaeon]